jgi:hypothetical protein
MSLCSLTADLFTIDEVCLFEGEWREETYAVSGDILDEVLPSKFE